MLLEEGRPITIMAELHGGTSQSDAVNHGECENGEALRAEDYVLQTSTRTQKPARAICTPANAGNEATLQREHHTLENLHKSAALRAKSSTKKSPERTDSFQKEQGKKRSDTNQ